MGMEEKTIIEIAREDEMAPLRILLLAVGSPEHYSQWNVLSCEALAGDLLGFWKDAVHVCIRRVDTYEEAVSLRVHEYPLGFDILGFSPSLGALDLLDRIWAKVTEAENRSQKTLLKLLGNKLPSYFPGHCLQRYPGSVVVRGEAEITFRKLVGALRSGQPLSVVPNLAYSDKTGHIRFTPVERCDVSQLIYPPTTDTVPQIVDRGGNVLVQSSRGCSWSACTYCTCRSFRGGRRREPLPLRRVEANLRTLARIGAREFEFADDEFLGERNDENLCRARQICGMMHEISQSVGEALAFRAFFDPLTIFRTGDEDGNRRMRELLSDLKRVGMSSVYVGVESGCESQLRRYNRDGTLQDAVGCLQTLRSLGIHADLGFIMFDPFMNLQELMTNIRFFRDHKLIEGNQWPFRPLVVNEGAPLKGILAKHNMLGSCNPAFMSYGYEFRDDRVRDIAELVDSLSRKTRSLFYALKTMSKMSFSPERASTHVRLAKAFAADNARIYLDLMEALAQNDGRSTRDAALHSTSERVGRLVQAVNVAVHSGKLLDADGYLGHQLSAVMARNSSSNAKRYAACTRSRMKTRPKTQLRQPPAKLMPVIC